MIEAVLFVAGVVVGVIMTLALVLYYGIKRAKVQSDTRDKADAAESLANKPKRRRSMWD